VLLCPPERCWSFVEQRKKFIVTQKRPQNDASCCPFCGSRRWKIFRKREITDCGGFVPFNIVSAGCGFEPRYAGDIPQTPSFLFLKVSSNVIGKRGD